MLKKYFPNVRFIFLVRNPYAVLKTKRNLRFHFDMWHGNGNLDKAIDLLDINDRKDFGEYTRKNISYSVGNMFVCRSKKIINNYYFLYIGFSKQVFS